MGCRSPGMQICPGPAGRSLPRRQERRLSLTSFQSITSFFLCTRSRELGPFPTLPARPRVGEPWVTQPPQPPPAAACKKNKPQGHQSDAGHLVIIIPRSVCKAALGKIRFLGGGCLGTQRAVGRAREA